MNLSNLTNDLKIKTNFNANSALGLNDINGITGIVDNSVSSLQALIFANKDAKYDDIDVTNFDVTGITSGYDNVAFIFDLKKDYKYTLSSDITDHYVESNVAIQDHIGLRPIMLEVVGCISEVNLVDTKQDKVAKKEKGNMFNSIDSYLNRMGSLTSFAPNITNQALNVYNTAKYVYGTANKFINMVKKNDKESKKNIYTEQYDEEVIKQTKQFKWINWFTTQWKNRASFTIVTPYGVLKDMYIMDLNAVQPETTRYVTNLNIKFKQIRKAKVIKSSKKVSKTMENQSGKITGESANTVNVKTITKAEFGGDGLKRNNIGVDISNDIGTVAVSNNTAVASYNVSSSMEISVGNQITNKDMYGDVFLK